LASSRESYRPKAPPRPGVVGSLAASRLVNSFLFGVSATDPFVYTAAAVTMMVVALLGSALPALRAASADPIDALRSS
jgi:putative ABC transport system permease protein